MENSGLFDDQPDDAFAFESIAVPRVGASKAELDEYRMAANLAGANFRAEDVAAFDKINLGPQLVLGLRDDAEMMASLVPDAAIRANVLRMSEALAKQQQQTLAQTEPDMEREREQTALLTLELLGPIPPGRSEAAAQIYKDEMAALGVRLGNEELAAFDRAVGTHGVNGLKSDPRLSADLPLGAAMLVDLHRDQHKRLILNTDYDAQPRLDPLSAGNPIRSRSRKKVRRRARRAKHWEACGPCRTRSWSAISKTRGAEKPPVAIKTNTLKK